MQNLHAARLCIRADFSKQSRLADSSLAMNENETTLTVNGPIDSFLQRSHLLNPVDQRNLLRGYGTSTRNTITLKRPQGDHSRQHIHRTLLDSAFLLLAEEHLIQTLA
jgi:hypothetical protein